MEQQLTKMEYTFELTQEDLFSRQKDTQGTEKENC